MESRLSGGAVSGRFEFGPLSEISPELILKRVVLRAPRATRLRGVLRREPVLSTTRGRSASGTGPHAPSFVVSSSFRNNCRASHPTTEVGPSGNVSRRNAIVPDPRARHVDWRRGWDLNPRIICMINALAGRPIRPLWHLSSTGECTGHGELAIRALRHGRGSPVGWGTERWQSGQMQPP